MTKASVLIIFGICAFCRRLDCRVCLQPLGRRFVNNQPPLPSDHVGLADRREPAVAARPPRRCISNRIRTCFILIDIDWPNFAQRSWIFLWRCYFWCGRHCVWPNDCTHDNSSVGPSLRDELPRTGHKPSRRKLLFDKTSRGQQPSFHGQSWRSSSIFILFWSRLQRLFCIYFGIVFPVLLRLWSRNRYKWGVRNDVYFPGVSTRLDFMCKNTTVHAWAPPSKWE